MLSSDSRRAFSAASWTLRSISRRSRSVSAFSLSAAASARSSAAIALCSASFSRFVKASSRPSASDARSRAFLLSSAARSPSGHAVDRVTLSLGLHRPLASARLTVSCSLTALTPDPLLGSPLRPLLAARRRSARALCPDSPRPSASAGLSSAFERVSASPARLAAFRITALALRGRLRLHPLGVLDRLFRLRSRLPRLRLGDDPRPCRERSSRSRSPSISSVALPRNRSVAARAWSISARIPSAASGSATSSRSASSIGSTLSVSDKPLRPSSVGGLALGQFALQDLTRRIARKLLNEDDLARHLVASEIRLDVVLQLVLARVGTAPP